MRFDNQTDTAGIEVTEWKWDFGDGTVFYGKDPSQHGYLSTGFYTVTIIGHLFQRLFRFRIKRNSGLSWHAEKARALCIWAKRLVPGLQQRYGKFLQVVL